MLLSKSCVYGLRATLYLAAIGDEEYISIGKISEDLDISRHFLTKILQELTAEELLESYKGPKGGVRLARGADDISLLEIVKAIEGPELFTECVLGLPGCGMQKPCPIHHEWMNYRNGLQEMLAGTSLKKVAEEGKAGNMRLTAEEGLMDL